MLTIISIVAIAIVVLVVLSCCKVSGDCSREEERRNGN